jgi:hypothetical protein
MSIEQNRAMVVGRIWQAVAQSGVDLSSVPRDEQEKLIDTIADAVLVAADELLGEAGAPTPTAAATPGGADEQVLWEGRPFLSLFEHYTVTTERVRISKGVLGRDNEDVELIRLQDIDYSQRMTERVVNIGDITLRSADISDPEVVLRNVANPAQVHEIIRRAWLDARKRHGFQFREQM